MSHLESCIYLCFNRVGFLSDNFLWQFKKEKKRKKRERAVASLDWLDIIRFTFTPFIGHLLTTKIHGRCWKNWPIRGVMLLEMLDGRYPLIFVLGRTASQ